MKHYIVHTDGGSRGNPGEAAVGIIIDEKTSDGNIIRIERHGEYIGVATNNVAEYSAVSVALSRLIALEDNLKHDENIYEFYLDSLLVVQQLNGVYKVKNATLATFVVSIRDLEQTLGGTVQYKVVRRELNTDADAEVNKALDRRFSD